MCKNCLPLMKAISAYIAKEESDLEEQLTIDGFADAAETVKEINAVEEAVYSLLEAHGENIIKQLNEAVDLQTFYKDMWPKIKRGRKLGSELRRIFLRDFKRIVRKFASVYLKETDGELELTQITDRTTAWVSDWSGELASLMKLHTDERIEAVLKDGLEKGSSIETITRSIEENGIRAGYRARATALTETLRAHSVAQQEAFMQSPAVEGKMWRHTAAKFSIPRKHHQDMDGKRVPKEKPYKLIGADGGTYYPMYPRDSILPPSESVNCHCLSAPVVNEDVLGLSFDERKRLQQKAVEKLNQQWAEEKEAERKEQEAKYDA